LVRGTVSLRTIARSAGLLAGVLVTALLLAAAVVRLPSIQRWAAAQVSARLPAGVSIERAAITVLPPGVRLTQVTLGENGPTLKAVSCRLHVLALLGGRFEVGSVVVNGLAITVERGANGSFQLVGPLAPLLASASGAAADGSAAPAASTRSLAALPEVTVNNSSLTFIDRAARGGPRTLQLTDVRLTLGGGRARVVPLLASGRVDPVGQITVKGTLRETAHAGAPPDRTVDIALAATHLDANTVFTSLAAALPGGGNARAQATLDASLTLAGTLAAGLTGDAVLTQTSGSAVWDEVHLTPPLKLSAHLRADHDGVALSGGELRIAELTASRVIASDIEIAFAFAAPVLQVTAARATVYGGTWTQTGSVTLGDPPSYDVTVRADGIACQALLSAVTGEHPQYGCERLSADAAVRGVWTDARTVGRGASGTGQIEMRGGTIPSSSIIGAVWSAMVPLVHVGKQPDSLGPPTRVDRFTESFTLRSAHLHTSDLVLVTDDYHVTGAGSVGLDGSLNLNTEVAMTAEGVTKMLTAASLPIPGEPGSLPPIPTRITGSIGDPIIRPKVEQIPIAAVQTLFAGARGAGEELKDAAGQGVRSLRQDIDKLW
jgi:uncharacterized protein involved in outer membrane biogenesis